MIEGPAGLNSPRWSCSYEDALGRTISETRTGFRGALLVTSNEYNTANQLVATRAYALNENSTPTPLTYTYFCYNSLGQRTLTVSDMNLNGQIDWSDTDRIVSNDTRYVSLNGDWWRESSSWQTRKNGSSELTLMGLTRTRLTGLGDTVLSAPSRTDDGTGLLVAETRSFDPLGNETISRSFIDRTTHTTTHTTSTETSSLAAETIARCGLTVSTRSPTGVTTTYAYDALGRQIAQTDGRGNTSQVVYDAQGRVAKIIDALGHETTYTYDALGRQVAVTDPLGNIVTTTYDAEDHILAQRGATYPVDYAYDAYGNKVSMTTYRQESDIPMVGGDALGAPHAGDTTRWLYDEPSGCMTSKVYADGKGPSYAYTPDGKLARRTWARGVVTTYAYDNSGALTNMVYSDDTPTISMVYDRVGNMLSAVTDGVCTNLYAYSLTGLCTNEVQNGATIARSYDTLGRSTGYTLQASQNSVDISTIKQSNIQTLLSYDALGRIASLSIITNDSSNIQTFTYSYLLGTDIVDGYTCGNFSRKIEFEPLRNLVAAVTNSYANRVISAFDYTNDAAGRRTAISRSGEAFGDLSGATDSYGYNSRNEVISARRTKNGEIIHGFNEDFEYDPIGNRIWSTTYNELGEPETSQYIANNLNQYSSRTIPGYAAVRGHADADATVTVNEKPTYRYGEYFFGSDEFDNTSSPVNTMLETVAVKPGATEDEPDEIALVTNSVYLAKSPVAYEYDDDGNQTLVTTKTGTWRVTYNGENRPVRWERLISSTLNSNTPSLITMTFDHRGRRRLYLETAADGSTNSLDRFTYDNYLCIVRNRWQPDGTSATDRFIWDPTEPIATRPLAFHQPNAPLQLYSIDGNKNVSELVSSDDGTISAHYEYAPFGEVVLSSGDLALTNPFRFSSEYADDTLALVYYNYRHLELVTGRWMARDPIGESSVVLLYGYSNRLKTDYLGMEELDLSYYADYAGWPIHPWHPDYAMHVDMLNAVGEIGRFESKMDLQEKIWDRVGECDCIRLLRITAHGAAGDYDAARSDSKHVQMQLGSYSLLNEGYNLEKGVEMDDISEFFTDLKSKFCKKCTIRLVSCHLGENKYLADRIKTKTGCSVDVYAGRINSWSPPDALSLQYTPRMYAPSVIGGYYVY